MRKAIMFLFSFLLIFLFIGEVFAVEEDDDDIGQDLRRAREMEQKQRGMYEMMDAARRGDIDKVMIYSYRDAIESLQAQKPKVEQSCLQYDDEVMQNVQYGRYITAFELCKKQGKGTQECIQRVQEAKEKWRGRCKDADVSLQLVYYKAKLRAEEVKASLRKIAEDAPICGFGGGGGLNALVENEVYAFMGQLINRWFPGSQFSLQSGTGQIVASDAVLYYQGWIFIRGDFQIPGGLLAQVFENRINFTTSSYNIAVNLKTGQGWEVVEFNLPFDSQTEQLLLSSLGGRGVRLTNKEIIDLANKYLHDTVWEVDLPETFKKLLLQGEERRFFMESLVEYFTYDSYIKKVVAEEARQKQQQQEQQEKTVKKSKGSRR